MSNTSTMPTGGAGGKGHEFARKGYAKAEIHDLKTSDVENAKVHGRDAETIGRIKSLKVGTDGRITDAVIDVGGFLGIGAHSVVMPFNELTVLRETDGATVRVHLDTTKARLEAMPHHDG